jgi:dipeptidyl aminopeptidase/acylaminoacyl peptidase
MRKHRLFGLASIVAILCLGLAWAGIDQPATAQGSLSEYHAIIDSGSPMGLVMAILTANEAFTSPESPFVVYLEGGTYNFSHPGTFEQPQLPNIRSHIVIYGNNATINLHDSSVTIMTYGGLTFHHTTIQVASGTKRTFFNGGLLTLTDSSLTGGGIQNDGTLTLLRATLTENSNLSATAGGGGAVLNNKQLNARCTLFQDNTASQGGAIYNAAGGTASINESTFDGNMANGGSAIFNADAVAVNASHNYWGGSAPVINELTLAADTISNGVEFLPIAASDPRQSNPECQSAPPAPLPSPTPVLATPTPTPTSIAGMGNGGNSVVVPLPISAPINYVNNWNYLTGGTGITVMNPDGSTQVIAVAGISSAPVWSPDGERFVYQSYRDGNAELYVRNMATGTDTRITTNWNEDYNPSWSPDGQSILFDSNRNDVAYQYRFIFIAPADGSNTLNPQTIFVNNDTKPHYPVMSPDGTAIAVASRKNQSWSYTGNNIWLMRKNNFGDWTLNFRLTYHTNADTVSQFTWSSDGVSLYYRLGIGEYHGDTEFLIVDNVAVAVGAGRRLQTGYQNQYYLSPDQTEIAIPSSGPNISLVQIVNVDGSNRRYITLGSDPLWRFGWRPIPQEPRLAEAPNPDTPGPYGYARFDYESGLTVDSVVKEGSNINIKGSIWYPTNAQPSDKFAPIFFLHGMHAICARNQPDLGYFYFEDMTEKDYFDFNDDGQCPNQYSPQYVEIPSHRGYDQLAERLASWGYVVISINANQGINSGTSLSRGRVLDILPDGVSLDAAGDRDQDLLITRGRLILRHIQYLFDWSEKQDNVSFFGASLNPIRGKIDFTNIGLMGHSRGGEAARAALKLLNDTNYNNPNGNDPNATWQKRLTANNSTAKIKVIFEVAPTDSRRGVDPLDADGVAWAVLLGACDGDVFDLQAIRVFDRTLVGGNARQLAAFLVWGATHNGFNSNWGNGDPFPSSCISDINASPTPSTSFINQAQPIVTRAEQKQILIFTAMAWFRGNLWTPAPNGLQQTFNNLFNPLAPLPAYLTNAVQHTSKRFGRDFYKPLDSATQAEPTLNDGAISMHDENVGVNTVQIQSNILAQRIEWTPASTPMPPIPQTEIKTIGSSLNNAALYLRVTRIEPLDNRGYTPDPATVATPSDLNRNDPHTDFTISLVDQNNVIGNTLSVKNYVLIDGVPGSVVDIDSQLYLSWHTMLLGVRIPLKDFGVSNLTTITGIRLNFNRIQDGAIFIANIRLNAIQ